MLVVCLITTQYNFFTNQSGLEKVHGIFNLVASKTFPDHQTCAVSPEPSPEKQSFQTERTQYARMFGKGACVPCVSRMPSAFRGMESVFHVAQPKAD